MSTTTPTGPDTAALRAKRSRRHKAGDHSLCRDDRCAATTVTEVRDATVTASVQALLDELKFQPGDPRFVLGQVALQLAAALDKSPANVTIARELRSHVGSIAESPNSEPGLVDEIRARRAARRVACLIDNLEA